MVFNIDADPANADWLRGKEWNIPAETLQDLFSFLGVLESPKDEQVKVLENFMKTPTYQPSPLLLKKQAEEFINGFELDELTQEI